MRRSMAPRSANRGPSVILRIVSPTWLPLAMSSDIGSRKRASVSPAICPGWAIPGMVAPRELPSPSQERHNSAMAAASAPRPVWASASPLSAKAPESLLWPANQVLVSSACCSYSSRLRLAKSSQGVVVLIRASSKGHDLTNGAAVVQAVEAQIDRIEGQGPAHQPVDRQPAALVELDEAGNVAGGYGGADIA